MLLPRTPARGVLTSADAAPDEGGVVLRADGGLWVAAGHLALWVVFGVAAGAWRPVGGPAVPWP